MFKKSYTTILINLYNIFIGGLLLSERLEIIVYFRPDSERIIGRSFYMKRKAKWSFLATVLLAFVLVLSACGSGSKNSGGGSQDSSSASSGKLAAKQVLNVATNHDIPTLDYTQITDVYSNSTLQQVQAGLTRMHNNKVEYDLATGPPKISDDKKVYTFKLRDAKWADGKPVTAQQFVYGWQHENDPKAKPLYNFTFASVGIKNAAQIEDAKSPMYGKVDQLGIKAIDDKTLEIDFDKPAPQYALSLFSQSEFYPQRQDMIEKYGDKYGSTADSIVADGPFKLTSWNQGSSYTLEKNPSYWNADSIKVQQVNVNIIKELSTIVNLYDTGKADTAVLSGDFIAQEKSKNPDEVKSTLTSGTEFLYLNQKTNKNLKNLNLRKAINAAINRKDFTDVLLKDGSIPSNFVVPKDFVQGPDGKDFRADTPNGYPAGNAKDAKKYWNQAKKELGINSLNLTLLTPDDDTYKKMDEYIANQISKNLKGVKVSINQQPWGNYLKLNQSFKFDLAFSGWFPDYRDPMTYQDMWTTDNPQNTAGWSDKKYDALIARANNETGDYAKRWQDQIDAEKEMMLQYPIVPLYQQGKTWVQKSYVKGLDYPLYGPETDYTGVSILKH